MSVLFSPFEGSSTGTIPGGNGKSWELLVCWSTWGKWEKHTWKVRKRSQTSKSNPSPPLSMGARLLLCIVFSVLVRVNYSYEIREKKSRWIDVRGSVHCPFFYNYKKKLNVYYFDALNSMVFPGIWGLTRWKWWSCFFSIGLISTCSRPVFGDCQYVKPSPFTYFPIPQKY